MTAFAGKTGQADGGTAPAPRTALGGRLLVVDDDEMNRDMLSRRLVRAGHEVVVAVDGEAALRAVEQSVGGEGGGEGAFDVVLLDVMMPGIDGYAVLERLRALYPAERLSVIMATARDAREDVIRALGLGANDYVTKPLDFPVVLARVRTQLALKRAVDRGVALEEDLRRRNESLARANARMERDLGLAAKAQHALLPAWPPTVAGATAAWVYRPCDELAGDILNVFRLGEEHLGIYLLDVSGHGVQAALLSVTLSRMLAPAGGAASLVEREPEGAERGALLEPRPPAEVVGELNRRFPMDHDSLQYFTVIYGVLNAKTGVFRYACAGHAGPVLVPGSGGPSRTLLHPAMAVGWDGETVYEEQELVMGPGDRLVMYSDGVLEAMAAGGEEKGASAREQFGAGRIGAVLERTRDQSLAESLKEVVKAAGAWCGADGGEGADEAEGTDGVKGKAGFVDDVSMVAVEMGPAS